MIPVHVAQVSYSDEMGFVVLLRSDADKRTLPILIGQPEAQAIALVIDKIQVPRPLTHDLFKVVLDNLECRGTQEIPIDARPSDAIALALRSAVPILVASRVMEIAGVVFPDAVEAGKPPVEKKELTPLDRLKAQIQKAIDDERYEDAAKLRDEINKLTKHN